MSEVLYEDLEAAVSSVLEDLRGINELYPTQMELLSSLLGKESIFFTSATNSGKTLPCVIFPQILDNLIGMGYGFSPGKVLFVTNLNSIQLSMVGTMKEIGVKCAAITAENFVEVLASDIKVIFIGPEVIKLPLVSKCLLSHRSDFQLKCIDEAHLGMSILTLNNTIENTKKLN